MKTQKRKFFIIQMTAVVVSLVIMLVFHPQEKGWWLFKYIDNPPQFFAGAAFLIACLYMLLVRYWYNDSRSQFNCLVAVKAFLLGGLGSFLIVLFPFGYLWMLAGFSEVESGWWFLKSTELVARDPLFYYLEISGAIAGPIEELAKCLAVLLVPSVRRSITDRKTGIYYVVLSALGFAMFENIKYFVEFDELIVFRANPAHAVFSVIWGWALGALMAQEISFRRFLKFLVAGMAGHAAWNILATMGSLGFLLLFALISLVGLFFIYRELSKDTVAGSGVIV